MKKTDQNYIDMHMPKIMIFQKITCGKNASPRAEPHLKFSDQLIEALIGVKFFFSKWVMSGIKMSVFLRRFQKCKLTLGTKCA
jgi:hypothetical protein